VRRDFTLVIPTCNRAQLLSALLSYLEAEKADCHILVLDSSRPDVLAANRARVRTSHLDVEFAAFPELEPGEKCRQGIRKVTTPFCALCADGDVVILEGMRQCLDALRRNPAASVAQGRSFGFQPRPDGDMELNNTVDLRATIEDLSPSARLGNLFRQYQTTNSGMFRTPVLLRIFDALQPMTKVLARDLLWSALTVIEGQSLHLSNFSYGRSMGSSDTYDHSHPLEWLCKDPEGLFAEYLRYRELLAAAVMRRPDNELQPDEVRDLLDLIHLRYLVQHAPDSVLEFITEQQIAGFDFADYPPHRQTYFPLYDAATIGAAAKSQALRAVHMRGRERSYLLFPNFYAPRGSESPQLDSVIRLIGILDRYPPVFGLELTPKGG
jgi:glycosyltransferase domain-containing protein